MIDAVCFCIATLAGLAIVATLLARYAAARALVYGAAALVSMAILAASLQSVGSTPSHLILPIGLPWTGAHLRVDPLSALFLLVIGLGGAAASLYAIGYGRHERSPERVLPFYPLFLAGLIVVVIADDAFSFLFGWEVMSLASWALVMAHHREPANARAGYVYLLMASFSGLALLLAFGLLAGQTGDYTFDAIRTSHPAAWRAGVVLVLVLIGAGAKAGLVPLHAWLPLAHPAAPSHVSALMSGVMTKAAVYGFVRIVFDLLGVPPWWSGVVVLVLGGITAVLGVLYALMEHDLKRLLAYHTVENIGIIFIGFGLALAFAANGLGTGAALAMTAALFHVFNHSLFKSLLFFGVGAVLTATGERDMEHLGGLIHRMPKTSFTFLVGCAAISALPPLNGFVSEWLTFQAILVHPDLPQWGLKLSIPADGALLALSAALAAACFVKAFGITFLGRPRSAVAASAREVDGFSLAAMYLLTALCLLAGVLPGPIIDMLGSVTQMLIGARLPEQAGSGWLTIVPVEAGRSSYSGLLVFVFVTASALASAAVIHRFGSRAVRRGPAWDCGFPDPSPAIQYTAGSFAQPIRRVFGAQVFGARETVTMPEPGALSPARIVKTIPDPIWDTLYAPVGTAVTRTAEVLNQLQFLTVRRYLAFVFVALVLLLLVLVLWQ
ncbi:MAG: hydrogenase 4 subunit B [Acetobacteraceae bacterium]|nr:hydrogenase 4 subunit B [Acetobacteraceae bacterium]